jgi:plasmid stability protein
MARLNLTLDSDTLSELKRRARRAGRPCAAVARELLREALDRRGAVARRRKLARDYADGARDAREILRDLEAGQTWP